MKAWWNARSGRTKAIIVVVALLLIYGVVGPKSAPATAGPSSSSTPGASRTAAAPTATVDNRITGSDTTHWSCWDQSYLAANPTLGTSPHRFNAGPGKDHICTKQELDVAGIDPSVRPPDQK